MNADGQQHRSGAVAGCPRSIGPGESRLVIQAWVRAAQAAAILRVAIARAGMSRATVPFIAAAVEAERPVLRVRVTDPGDPLATALRRAVRHPAWPRDVRLVVEPATDRHQGRTA